MATRRSKPNENTTTAARRPSVNRQNEVELRLRVEELEKEVSSLKQRLNELRKAKNTTILKREREVINVQAPNLGRRDSQTDPRSAEGDTADKLTADYKTKLESAEKKASDLEKKYQQDLKELREKFAAEVNELKKNSEKKSESCATCPLHEMEKEALKTQMKLLHADKDALMVQNMEHVNRIEELITDLSIKEAKWCEMEENYKKKMQETFNERYREWMAKTEGKLAELAQANALLRSLVRKPEGPDPTGQDP